MASLRRSKALSPDGQTAKFLYTIIKQLDLKSVDWNEVASGLEITNGHAARMRYSRFKAQIEGLPTQSKPRAPRPKKDGSTAAKGKGKNKLGYEPGKVDNLKGEDDDGDVKMEQENGPVIKQEGLISDALMSSSAAVDTLKVKPEPGMGPDSIFSQKEDITKVKQEPAAEPENLNLSPTSGIAAMNINSYSTPPPTPTVSALGFLPGPPIPADTFPRYHVPSTMPPHATVSLAELQLPPIPKPMDKMSLPTYSYPLTPIEFAFDLHAPMPQHQLQNTWQPQFDIFRPVSVKQEMMKL